MIMDFLKRHFYSTWWVHRRDFIALRKALECNRITNAFRGFTSIQNPFHLRMEEMEKVLAFHINFQKCKLIYSISWAITWIAILLMLSNWSHSTIAVTFLRFANAKTLISIPRMQLTFSISTSVISLFFKIILSLVIRSR